MSVRNGIGWVLLFVLGAAALDVFTRLVVWTRRISLRLRRDLGGRGS